MSQATLAAGRMLLVLGGFTGFAAAFLAALIAGNDSWQALRVGAVGCLAGGALARAFVHVLYHGVRTAAEERRLRRQVEEAAAEANAEAGTSATTAAANAAAARGGPDRPVERA